MSTCTFLNGNIQYALEALLGITGQGTYAFSRSMLASLVPPHLAARAMALKVGLLCLPLYLSDVAGCWTLDLVRML